MPKIEIYSTSHCPYCVKAKNLLTELGQTYTEINIEEQPEKREEMMIRSGGRRTVPQIFINGTHIGGCDDMYGMHQSGALQKMLSE